MNLKDEERAIWEAFDKEVTALVEGGGTAQAIARISSGIASMESESMTAVRARALARRAELRLDLEDGEGAMTDAKRALSMGYREASVYGSAGWAAYYLDKSEQSRDYFDKALLLEPDGVSLLTGRALALIEFEEWELARADLTRVLQLDDEPGEALALLGEVCLRTNDLKGAVDYLGRALEEGPDAEIALNLARALYVKGDITGALTYVDFVEDDAEEMFFEALLFRSFLRAQNGMIDEARSDAIRASNLYPDEAFAFVQLAQVEMAAEKVNMVRKAAERAVLLDPSLPDAYLVRGAAYQMMGKEEEAAKDFKRAQKAPLELPLFLLGSAHGAIGAASQGGENLFDLFGAGGLFGKDGAAGFDPSTFASAFESLGGLGGLGGLGDFGNFAGFSPEAPGEEGEKRDSKDRKGKASKGPIPGMDPMGMLGQIFDESGNVKGSLKPLFDMALKNAPKIMKNMPPGLLAGVDPEELERLQKGEVSSDEIEARMREFYEMMKSGDEPEDEK